VSLVEDVEGADIVRVRADNPGPLTLSGTNTWVIGRDPAWVVDPGPADETHLQTVADIAAARGGAGGVALTHDHIDHTEGTPRLLEILGGVEVGPGPLEVVAVPGHSDDHVVFVWQGAAFTGDAVLGEGSVFVQGALGAYLDALRRLRAMDLRLICPGHGPVVLDPAAKLDGYLAHRLERERRLLDALQRGLRSEDELLDAAWSEVPAVLRPAAAITLQAHLGKLRDEGRLPR
jgi:glyoxylase-like metal-dependent hydrolase (beta-lactamase superfamily II)